MKEFVGIATKQCPRQHNGAIARGGERPQRVPLRSLATLQLVDFVRNAVIEKPTHVPADEFDRRHPVDLLVVGLPERTKERLPGLVRFGPQRFCEP